MKVSVSAKIPFALLLLGAFALVPSTASAQVCRGGIPFASSVAQGQAAVEVEDGSTVYAIAGGKGGAHWYGMGTFAVRMYEAREGSTIVFGFGGGRTFKHRITGTAQHCLEIRGDFGTGPDASGPVRADESSSSVTFDFTTGLPLSSGSALSLTPFAGVSARYQSIVTQGDQASVSNEDFYELVTLGLGLTVGGDVALQPYAQFPLGRDLGSDPLFGMRLSLKIGTKP